MNKWKKAISTGMSAALVASLFTFIAAGSVSASVTATSAGTFAPGTTSPNTVTFTFVERHAADLATGAGSLTVTINDADGGNVTFTGTPSTTGSTGSLGAGASIAGAVLTVTWDDSDPGSVETIIVSGLKIKADSSALPGPIRATLGGTFAPFFAPSATSTTTASGVIQDSNELTAGADSADVLLSSVCPFAVTAANVVNSLASFSDSSDPRAVTAAPAAVTGVQTVTFAAGTASHAAGTTVTQTVSQLDCGAAILPAAVGIIANALAFADPTKPNVFPGETNSGPAGNLTLTEPAAGFLTDGTTITVKINTAGVLFSNRPIALVTTGDLFLTGNLTTPVAAANEVQTVTVTGETAGDTFTLTFSGQTTAALAADTATAAQVQTALENLSNIAVGDVAVTGAAGGPFTITFGGLLAATNVAQMTATPTGTAAVAVATTTQGAAFVAAGSAPMTLSADRTSASVVVDTASTVLSVISIRSIFYDVASTVAGGTFIDVTVSAGSKLVNPTHRTNAVVGRGLNATATPTTVFIGQNGQKTGLVTVTELAAGFFQGGTGTNNTIEVCLLNNAETFTSPGPSAKVTAGDLVLRSGDAAAAAGAAVLGTAIFFVSTGDTCYYWKVWTASTVVSTIVIGNSDFSSGPLIDVPANSVPGAVNMSFFVGNDTVIPNTAAVSGTVQIATAVFQNQVVVTALSQPTIPKGATDALAGNIQVAETATGQLKSGETICVEVLPRASNFFIQDTFLKALNTADVPIATVSGGVLVSPVTITPFTCNELQTGAVTPSLTHTSSFLFTIQQQSVAGTGKVVISNIHYITTADAPNGPVLVNVFGFGGSPTFVEFQSTISNARIGSVSVAEATINAGLNTRTGFGFGTEVVKRGAYVTIRSRASGSAAGDLVQIWVKTKTTAWKLETSRRVSPNGFMYYSGKVLNLGYRYYRVAYTSTGAISNTVRAFGK